MVLSGIVLRSDVARYLTTVQNFKKKGVINPNEWPGARLQWTEDDRQRGRLYLVLVWYFNQQFLIYRFCYTRLVGIFSTPELCMRANLLGEFFLARTEIAIDID